MARGAGRVCDKRSTVDLQMAFSLLMFWIMMLRDCRSWTVTPHDDDLLDMDRM